MKKTWLFLLASALAFGGIAQTEAALIRIDGPGVAITHREPIEAIIVDSNGNAYRQIVYYNPSVGGIDLDTTWAGPNASIYFPAWGIGYVWYNGYWVDASGYYWDGSRRAYIDYPNWNNYWTTYWHRHWHDDKYGWQDRRHDHWHDRDYGDWRGRGDHWRRYSRRHDGDFDGDRYDGWKRGDDFDGDRRDGWRRDGDFDGERRAGWQRGDDFDGDQYDGRRRGGDFDGERRAEWQRRGDIDAGRRAGWQRDADFDTGRGAGGFDGGRPDVIRSPIPGSTGTPTPETMRPVSPNSPGAGGPARLTGPSSTTRTTSSPTPGMDRPGTTGSIPSSRSIESRL